MTHHLPPKPYATWPMRLGIALYALCWHLLSPLFFVYLWRRGKREPLYRQFWRERLGLGEPRLDRPHPLWVHAASLGELRGAAPVIQALLDLEFRVVVTTWTPAGRQAANSLFETAVREHRLQVCYVPAEWPWAVANFIRRWQPRCAMVTESEAWPVLLSTIRSRGLPLCKANAQYPSTSYRRDLRWGGFRARLYSAYELVMCKSRHHAQRFNEVGCDRVAVVGETRFEQTIAPALLSQAAHIRGTAGWAGRPVVCFASAIVGEDETFIETALLLKKTLNDPLFVYVPRSPQRFDAVNDLMRNAGLRVLRRSTLLDARLHPNAPVDWSQADVLLGDSLGEMYFYLALAQVVVVGASFVDMGAHNVIEPLALKKPVWVGPSIWGIEYPGVEALQAGVLHQAQDGADLARQLAALLSDAEAYAAATLQAEAFFAEHGGSTAKHLAVFLPWLQERTAS